MNSIEKHILTLEQIAVCAMEVAFGCAQMARHDPRDMAKIIEAVESLRTMHALASGLLTDQGGWSFPLISLDPRQAITLEMLGGVAFKYKLDTTIGHILTGFVDGISRPSSWERECVEKFFPVEAVEVAESAFRRFGRRDAANDTQPTGLGPVEPPSDK